MTAPQQDPAAAIYVVAVPGHRDGIHLTSPRDVLFVQTELGYVYRIVDGGEPQLVFKPQPIKAAP